MLFLWIVKVRSTPEGKELSLSQSDLNTHTSGPESAIRKKI